MKRRIAWVFGGLLLLLVGSCLGGLLPDRFVVNGPIAQALWGRGGEAPPESALVDLFELPAGFEVERYAGDLPGVRMLRVTPRGHLIASLPWSGGVVLLRDDRDGDGKPDGRSQLLEGLDRPHGLDLHDGWLYVGESGAVGRIRFDDESGTVSGPYERVHEDLPAGGNHWSRTLRFGPDGLLYLSVGSSCNVCVEKDPRRAAILRMRPDGGEAEIYATGLRNAVGFAWRPEDGALYATDNGRDLLGDDIPPCELNRVEKGAHYGWPFANGDRVPDPNYGEGREGAIAASRPPVHAFRAHNAPLGIAFIGDRGPPSLRGQALVALHGSWNRTRKDGYKVVSLRWKSDGSLEETDFMTGFLAGAKKDDVIGRPVDVGVARDGSLLISDDYAGVIYRVRALP